MLDWIRGDLNIRGSEAPNAIVVFGKPYSSHICNGVLVQSYGMDRSASIVTRVVQSNDMNYSINITSI